MPLHDYSPRNAPDWENRAEPLSRQELARVDRLARKLDNVSAVGMEVVTADDGLHFGARESDSFEAVITGFAFVNSTGTSSTPFYTFFQALYLESREDWVPKEGGIVGTEANNFLARERGGNLSVAPGTPVRMERVGPNRWAFAFCCAEPAPGPGTGSGSGSGPAGTCSPPCDVTPSSVALKAEDFLDGAGTGYCANFNGEWHLDKTGPCSYAYADGVRSFHADIQGDGSWDVHLWTSDGPVEVRYKGGSGCCATQLLPYLSTVTGACGAHPGTVTLVPACGTIPCPTPCERCDAGVAPDAWSFTSGAADWADDGACTWGQLNSRTVAVDHRASACEWNRVTAAFGHRPRVYYAAGWVLEVFNAAGACTVLYKNATATDCCSPMTLTRFGGAAPGTPASVVLTPSGGCCPATDAGGVSTTCFGGATLGAAGTATVNDLGGCACWAGQNFPVVWDGTAWHGTKTVAGCGGVTMTFDLYPDPAAVYGHCLYGLVSFSDGSLGAGATVAADPSSPSPAFVWTSNPFGGGAGAAGCTGPGGLTITVTGL